MKEVLKVKKTIIFPGLGRLRATIENHFFFVADEDLDIYPAGFGLQPLSLKTHEETQDEVAEAVASLATLLHEEPEAVAEAETVIPGPDRESPEMADQVGHDEEPVVPDERPVVPDEEPVGKKKKKNGWSAFWTVMLALLVLALLTAIALVVAGQFAPEWIDSLLYSPEEYEFLHNQ